MKNIINKIEFPEFSGLRCNMMPFIQGDISSLPGEYRPYSKIIEENYLERGEIGFLTIDERFVNAGKTQRGFNSFGLERNVHIEVGKCGQENCWGDSEGGSWGGGPSTFLDGGTMVLIANSISGTCLFWDTRELRYTRDGDLSEYIGDYHPQDAVSLGAGDVAKISIFTPHECVSQEHSSNRQFFRIVGKGVRGREDYFTINPLVNY